MGHGQALAASRDRSPDGHELRDVGLEEESLYGFGRLAGFAVQDVGGVVEPDLACDPFARSKESFLLGPGSDGCFCEQAVSSQEVGAACVRKPVGGGVAAWDAPGAADRMPVLVSPGTHRSGLVRGDVDT
jgi:hypothetical protein